MATLLLFLKLEMSKQYRNWEGIPSTMELENGHNLISLGGIWTKPKRGKHTKC